MGLDVWALTPEEEAKGMLARDCSLCFRDTYAPCSLANWLTRNIDPTARGQWGLAIFTEPQSELNTPRWRLEFYRVASAWRNQAVAFSGRFSVVGYPQDQPLILRPSETEKYIEALESLHWLARQVWIQRLRVHVSL